MEDGTHAQLRIGQEVLVTLADGFTRFVMGTVTDLGFDLIRQEHYLRIDDGQNIGRSNVYGIRSL
jgi:hypothetical protein